MDSAHLSIPEGQLLINVNKMLFVGKVGPKDQRNTEAALVKLQDLTGAILVKDVKPALIEYFYD